MTPQETEKNIREIWKLFRETDRKFQETDHRFKKTEKLVRDTSKQVGELGNKWGSFVEGLVTPAIKRGLFASHGILVDKVSRNIEASMQGRNMEIDVLAINKGHVVLVEIKSTLAEDDVKVHLKRLEEFKEFFPEYADRKIVGAVAALVLPENVGRFAYRKGLFVIAQKGDQVEIINDEKFRAKEW